MLSTPCKNLALDPILVKESSTVQEVLKIAREDLPIFIISSKIGVVSIPGGASADDKVKKFATFVDPIKGEEPIYRAAQVMVEKEILSVPIKDGEKIKGITHKIVLGALKSTNELAKREAKTVAAHVPLVYERRTKNAENIANKSGLSVLPIVNENNKLTGIWVDGKVKKKPLVAREGTRIKLIVDKVIKSPVVVINKYREPIGIITVWDLLELSASYKELTVPIFYSGVDSLSLLDRNYLKKIVERYAKKISRLVNSYYLSFYIKKRGTWKVRIKLSTEIGMFNISREGINAIETTEEACEALFSAVSRERDRVVNL